MFSPASVRNGPHILKILKKILPSAGTVLEVAAGSGQHAVMFAPEFPNLMWLPTDPADDKLTSIQAWMKEEPSDNILKPLKVDASETKWPVESMKLNPPISALICINMIHIAPWPAGQGLLAAAGRNLPKKGVFYLYGPFNEEGKFTAPSNQDFDVTLKRNNPEWGLRDLGVVVREAAMQGLNLQEVFNMPANNKSVVFRKS